MDGDEDMKYDDEEGGCL